VCPCGTYCAGGAAAPTTCPAGFFCPAGTGDFMSPSPTPTGSPTATASAPPTPSPSPAAWVLAGAAVFGNASAPGALPVYATPAGANLAGAAWWSSRVAVGDDFTLTARVRFTQPSSGGADGLVFALHNDPRGLGACGGNNLGLGWTGVTPSFGIRLDCWNSAHYSSLSALYNGALPSTIGNIVPPFDWSSGNTLAVRIAYRAASTNVSLAITDTATNKTLNAWWAVDLRAQLGCASGAQGWCVVPPCVLCAVRRRAARAHTGFGGGFPALRSAHACWRLTEIHTPPPPSHGVTRHPRHPLACSTAWAGVTASTGTFVQRHELLAWSFVPAAVNGECIARVVADRRALPPSQVAT
jgi:hypothetical protein